MMENKIAQSLSFRENKLKNKKNKDNHMYLIF